MAPKNATYAARAKKHQNPLARQLLELMERKESNLAVSVDVVKSEELLRIVDQAGPHVCIVKTHIDIVEDFTKETSDQLTALSKKHDFLIFEDRKFADIGNTVSLQYSSGVYKIASWAHITNAHAVPGDGVVAGLKKIGQPLGRGLLMLAEMSSAGSLAVGSYTEATVEMARRHQDFVMGFIAQRRMSEREDEDFLVLTPGVQMESKGDSMGQQYRTPQQVIEKDGCDVIIVGRGIYGQPDKIDETSRMYKAAGWEAYQRRCSQ